MKRHLASRHLGILGTAVLAGTLFLGLGIGVGAQNYPQDAYPQDQYPQDQYPQSGYPQQYPNQQYPQGSARQQPEEIPVPFPGQQGQQPYPPQQYPQQYPPQAGQPDQGQQQAAGDSGAARVSYIHGDLSTQRADNGEWVAATLNTPVVTGDRLATSQGSRAEIQLDYANILRMSSDATANITNISANRIQVQIGQGLVNFDVIRGSDADVEIDTPNVSIHPRQGPGSYRILVNSDGETIIDVREGSAEISTPQGSDHVEKGQSANIEGTYENAQYQINSASRRDDWDKWNSDRDHAIESAESWRHTNRYYTGSEDLDPYGEWRDVPDYGSVWFPQADSGWAPYRDGRWVYEPYYGWTWVSYEPWGWAPYHYGRWFVYGGNWGWWPGPVYGGYRPIWAPAYVSFIGFGGGGYGGSIGFGFGYGFGSVGWLPIGPGDRYYPWYGRGVNRVNVVNIYDVHNHSGGFSPLRQGSRAYSNLNGAFTNDRIRNGVSSMRADQFGRGRVPTQQQRFDAGSFRQASVMTGSVPVTPGRESYRPSDRQVNTATLPNQGRNNQRFFSGSINNARGNTQGQRQGGNLGRSGVPAGNPPQQNSVRPGFRTFSSNQERSNINNYPNNSNYPGNRQAAPVPQVNQPQNSVRPGYRGYSSGDPAGNSRYDRPNYPQPSDSPRQQAQPYYRGNPGNAGYSRPPLEMRQPVVTPRVQQQAPAPRSAPSEGNYRGGGGGYQGGGSPRVESRGGGYQSGGSPRGESRGGGSQRGGSSQSSGSRSDSGHGRR